VLDGGAIRRVIVSGLVRQSKDVRKISDTPGMYPGFPGVCVLDIYISLVRSRL
jgi:hypothetical protein